MEKCQQQLLETLVAHPPRSLMKEEVEGIRRDLEEKGYAVLPSFLPEEQVQVLRERAFELIDAWSLPVEHKELTIFQTRNQEKKDPYFLTSADKIRFFFEEAAFHPTTQQLLKPKREAINKIAHALHVLDPVFRSFTHQEHVRRIATEAMGLKEPAVVQSMVILKQPGVGGEVSVHQDSAFLHTEPLSCHAFWYALEETHQGNGCLWVLPGSHKKGVPRRFVNRPENDTLTFEPPKDAPPPLPEFDENTYLPVQVPKGSLVLLHGSVYHRSDRNLSSQSRNVYTFHILDLQARYSPDNWLQLSPPNTFDPLLPKPGQT